MLPDRSPPRVNETLYRFVDLLDAADTLRIITAKVIKIHKVYTYIQHFTASWRAGTSHKLRNDEVLRTYARTAAGAVQLVLDTLENEARAKRQSASLLDKQANQYRVWLLENFPRYSREQQEKSGATTKP